MLSKQLTFQHVPHLRHKHFVILLAENYLLPIWKFIVSLELNSMLRSWISFCFTNKFYNEVNVQCNVGNFKTITFARLSEFLLSKFPKTNSKFSRPKENIWINTFTPILRNVTLRVYRLCCKNINWPILSKMRFWTNLHIFNEDGCSTITYNKWDTCRWHVMTLDVSILADHI